MLFLLMTLAALNLFGYANSWHVNMPPRSQWNGNFGYCGEVSLISAGLYYGQYISQYDARAAACNGGLQSTNQLLIGVNDQLAATKMHLNSIEWNTDAEETTTQFLDWIKQNITQGYPVIIGIYNNEYLFDGTTDPFAGDPDYDHIVPVSQIDSNSSHSNAPSYTDDRISFSDNGIWETSGRPTYTFSYIFHAFKANRKKANAPNGPVYSLPNTNSNYGIAITGVMDLNGDTLPVRVETSVNYEYPVIENGSNTRPAPMPLSLTITVSHLETGVLYNLYRYNTLESVPNSEFNAHASDAYESWQFQIDSGSTYSMTEDIHSNEIAVYRAVKATAP